MARLVAGMGTSHVPGVGAAMDNGKTDEPYWAKLFEGFAPLRAWAFPAVSLRRSAAPVAVRATLRMGALSARA